MGTWEYGDSKTGEVITSCDMIEGSNIEGKPCLFIDRVKGTWDSNFICHLIALQKRYNHIVVSIQPNGIHYGILKELDFTFDWSSKKYGMLVFGWKSGRE